jgi:hypothetical protein
MPYLASEREDIEKRVLEGYCAGSTDDTALGKKAIYDAFLAERSGKEAVA